MCAVMCVLRVVCNLLCAVCVLMLMCVRMYCVLCGVYCCVISIEWLRYYLLV